MTINRRSTLGLLLAGGLLGSITGAKAAEDKMKKGKDSMVKILPGAEPFSYKGNDTAVLVVHGFTGSTQSMRYLGEQLNKRFGFTVSGPRLAGHGTSPDDMETTSYLDWVGSAEAALQELAKTHKKVYVTGLSMGGTITYSLAARFPKIVAGIAPINGVAGIVSPGLTDLMMLQPAPKRVPGIGADIKAKGVDELAYKEDPVSCLRDIYLLQAVTSDLLPKITCPALITHSKEDHVVPVANGDHVVSKIKSEKVKRLTLENSYHVATLDNDKDLIVDSVGGFFKELAG